MIARVFAVLGLIGLAACQSGPAPTGPATLGDFRLGYNIVQANGVEQGPFSREASEEQLTTALEQALQARLGRYDGDGLYHIGVAMGAYVLALPGLPIVYTPKSVLMFDINIYDNATEQRLNAEPKRITAFEGIENIAPIVGSGLVRSGDEQLQNLAQSGARAVESWLADNPDWFTPEPGQTRIPFDRAAGRARAQAAIAARTPAASRVSQAEIAAASGAPAE